MKKLSLILSIFCFGMIANAESMSGSLITTTLTGAPSVASIVDQAGETWTLAAGVVYKTSAKAGFTAGVTNLLYYTGVIYQNVGTSWWAWQNNTWVVTSDPRVTSPDGTKITTAGQTLIDTNHDVWQIVSGQAYENGALAGTTSGVASLQLVNGNIYQENTLNNFYVWSATSSSWPVCAPPNATLTVDFSTNESLAGVVGATTTFSRLGNATYFDSKGVMRTAGTNIARFDNDPSTLAPRGVLIEAATTNIAKYSEDFSNAAWVNSGLTLAATNSTVIAAPDSNATADYFTEPAGNTLHQISQTITSGLTAGHYASFSVFVRPYSTAPKFYFALMLKDNASNSVYAKFNLMNSPAIANPGYSGATSKPTAMVEKLANGWFRLGVSGLLASTMTSVTASIGFTDANGNISYAGSGTQGALIWGAQLEGFASPVEHSFSTSYIPNLSNATTTRNADSLVLNKFNYVANTQTVVAEFAREGYEPTAVNNYPRVYQFEELSSGGGTASSVIYNNYIGGGMPFLSANFSGSPSAGSGIAQAFLPTAFLFNRVAMTYNGTTLTSALNGVVGKPATVTAAPIVDTLLIGRGAGVNQILNGWVRKLTYWPVAVGTNELATLTTNTSINVLPAPNAVGGYNTLKFSDNFTSSATIDMNNTHAAGFNWYTYDPYNSTCNTKASDLVTSATGLLMKSATKTCATSTGTGDSIYTAYVTPAGQVTGATFSGGGYFEASVAFDPATVDTSSGAWPSFWASSVKSIEGAPAHWPGVADAKYHHNAEIDILEYGLLGSGNLYAGSLHDWYGDYKVTTCAPYATQNPYCDVATGPNKWNQAVGNAVNYSTYVPTLTNFKAFHRYGVLWVPSVKDSSGNYTIGYVQYYFDGVPTSDRQSWIGTPPTDGTMIPAQPWGYSITDNDQYMLILDTGGSAAMQVQYVHAYQK